MGSPTPNQGMLDGVTGLPMMGVNPSTPMTVPSPTATPAPITYAGASMNQLFGQPAYQTQRQGPQMQGMQARGAPGGRPMMYGGPMQQ